MHAISFRVCLCVLGLTALTAAVITASALSPALGTGPEGITSFSGTSSGAIVTSHNAGTGQAISASGSTGAGTGVIYATTAAAGSTAIRGYSTSTSATPSYGVIGVSKNAYGVEALTYSPSSLALFALNAAVSGGAIKGQSPGNAITGISTKANGVVGQVSATPTPLPSAIIAQAGVLGQDTSPSFHNAGVAGRSTNGIGVFAASTDGVGIVASGGDGVDAKATSSGTGVAGSSSSGTGVDGVSATSYGVHGNSTGNGSAASGSVGGFFESTNSGVNPTLLVLSHSGDDEAIRVTSGFTDIMLLDTSGNLSIKGTLVTGGSCHSGCVVIKNTAGRQLQAYTSAASVPSVEDFGSGQLTGGHAYVRIDPTFASTMDTRASYLVFITPEGDSRGLYVAQKTHFGFVVRENQGGRATLAFNYRIVAKPFASNEARLPVYHRATVP